MRYSFLLAIPLVALGSTDAAPEGPPIVNVRLSNFKFTPKTIILDHGRTYVLRIHNVAGGGHDFTARDFFDASSTAAPDRHRVADGEIEVPPGQVREVRLVAPAAGRYKLKCTHSFHKTLGMSGTIVVR